MSSGSAAEFRTAVAPDPHVFEELRPAGFFLRQERAGVCRLHAAGRRRRRLVKQTLTEVKVIDPAQTPEAVGVKLQAVMKDVAAGT